MDQFTTLPLDVHRIIFGYLAYRHYCHLRRLSRRWKVIIDSLRSLLWNECALLPLNHAPLPSLLFAELVCTYNRGVIWLRQHVAGSFELHFQSADRSLIPLIERCSLPAPSEGINSKRIRLKGHVLYLPCFGSHLVLCNLETTKVSFLYYPNDFHLRAQIVPLDSNSVLGFSRGTKLAPSGFPVVRFLLKSFDFTTQKLEELPRHEIMQLQGYQLEPAPVFEYQSSNDLLLLFAADDLYVYRTHHWSRMELVQCVSLSPQLPAGSGFLFPVTRTFLSDDWCFNIRKGPDVIGFSSALDLKNLKSTKLEAAIAHSGLARNEVGERDPEIVLVGDFILVFRKRCYVFNLATLRCKFSLCTDAIDPLYLKRVSVMDDQHLMCASPSGSCYVARITPVKK